MAGRKPGHFVGANRAALILRSVAKRRVSKDEGVYSRAMAGLSFETPASLALRRGSSG
jgi:hypothetical protein